MKQFIVIKTLGDNWTPSVSHCFDNARNAFAYANACNAEASQWTYAVFEMLEPLPF